MKTSMRCRFAVRKVMDCFIWFVFSVFPQLRRLSNLHSGFVGPIPYPYFGYKGCIGYTGCKEALSYARTYFRYHYMFRRLPEMECLLCGRLWFHRPGIRNIDFGYRWMCGCYRRWSQFYTTRKEPFQVNQRWTLSIPQHPVCAPFYLFDPPYLDDIGTEELEEQYDGQESEEGEWKDK